MLRENISIKFFFDFVPPCTEIPEDLFKTTKSSLLSIISFSLDLTVSKFGINLFLFLFSFNLKLKLNRFILSFKLSLVELLTF